MTRALSLTCTALLVVGLSGAAFAKPSIAVLGLEVIDQSGTPTAADTQAAKELSESLRARAKAGTGPYQLAPASDKELIDQKLLNNCDSEAAGCMAAIGKSLSAEILMYGHFEKQGKNYQVTLWVLDVGRKKELKTTTELVPVNEASGAALQGWAKKLYARLTGESVPGGTVVVKVSNADRGTILVDGEPKGSFSNGSGSVSGIDGKVRIGVEAEGFRRWEKDVTVGSGSQTIPVSLEESTDGGGGGSGIGDGGNGNGGGGSIVGGTDTRRGDGTWKGVAIGALLVSGGSVGIALWGNSIRYEAQQKLCNGGSYNPEMPTASDPVIDPKCPKPSMVKAGDELKPGEVEPLNERGDKGKWMGRIGAGVAIGTGAFALYAIYKGFIAKNPSSSERQSTRGKRVRKNRTFVVTPIMSPDGGGATFRVDW